MKEEKIKQEIDLNDLMDMCARAAAPTAANATLVRVVRIAAPMALSGFLAYMSVVSNGVVDASISAFLMVFGFVSFLLGGYAVVKFWD